MDENLTSVGDLVNEALAQEGDSGIKEGIQSQAELDAEKAPVEPVAPVAQEGIESKEAPIAPVISPIQGGDTVEGAAPVAPVEPVVDPFDTKWNENFKDRTIEDVQRTVTESDQLKLRNEELESLNKDYAGKLSQKVNPWANPEIAELNSFVKETGITDSSLFQKLKNSNIQEMDARGVLEIQMKKDNPDLSQSEIKDYIQGHYNLDKKSFDHIIDDDEREMKESEHAKAITRSETALKIDGNKARVELIRLKEKIKPVDLAAEVEATQRATQENVQKMTNDWSPHITKSVDELRQFPIEIPGENGQSQKLASFEVPADKLAVYKQQAMQFAINNGIEANNLEGQKNVNQFMANLIMIDFKDQIIQKTVNATRASMESEVEIDISNPSGERLPLNPSTAPKGTPKPRTAEDHEEEAFTAAEKQILDGNY